MSVRMAPPLPLILLLIFPDVSGGGGWGVTHISSHICALEGSSVIMPCTYTYPPGHQVEKVFWTKTTSGTGGELPNLFNDPEYRQRIQYLGDKQHNCTIRLTRVKQADSHKYYFGFTTNMTGGNYTGTAEMTLNVTDLQVEASEKVKEGDSVALTCKTTCRPTDTSTFVWLKNMKSLRKRTDVNTDKLVLRSVKREDKGNYSCSVRGHNLISPEHRLNVMYPPEKTLAAVSPSGEIVEGDSVTLTCRSDANPPVHSHTWFKEKSPVGSGKIYRITSIRSDHGGEYKCKVFNDYGERYSNAVILNVTYPPKNVSVSISPSGVIVEGDPVTLTCSSESNPPANISWFKGGKFVGSGNIYRILNIRSDHSGEYKCKTKNKHGEKYSAVTLNVLYPPRNVSASISSSGVIVEGDSVNLTCSSESNPPVHIYSWFKENQTSSVGSGQTYSISNINSSLSGWFYCVAQNKHGSQRSDAVPVIFDGGQNALLAGVISGLGGLFFIFILLVICKTRKKRSNNNGGDQENDSTHEDMSKRHDEHKENIYTNFIPACSIESVCESPADVDCNNDIYGNVDPEDMPTEDVYCTPDVPGDNQSDDTYVNPDMCRSFESSIICKD